MPLVRYSSRNEYSSGQPDLYKRDADREDPKAVLDGVSVAGLVGILRQLGDLAEFAAEVFHGLQEQVMATSSRSHKLMVRVQNIEAALPPLEKAVLAQTSHIHFAYTSGSEWHPRIRSRENHFIGDDLPRFIMDSYEECRDPPRLHLLDKFDTGGPGSCLKRYSDPTFFRKVTSNFKEPHSEKVQKDKKVRKIKKKRALQRNKDVFRSGSLSNFGSSIRVTAPTSNGRSSPSHTMSTNDMTLKSDLGDYSNSFDSRTGFGYNEHDIRLSSSFQPQDLESKGVSSGFRQQDIISNKVILADDYSRQGSSPEQNACASSCVTWEEKEETTPEDQHTDRSNITEMLGELTEIPVLDREVDKQENAIAEIENHFQMHGGFYEEDYINTGSHMNQLDEIETQDISNVDFKNSGQINDGSVCEAYPRSSSSVNQLNEVEAQDRRILELENPGLLQGGSHDEDYPKSVNNLDQLDEVESEGDNFVDALNTIESESENDFDGQTKYQKKQFSSRVYNDKIQDRTDETTPYFPDHQVEQVSCNVNNAKLTDGTNALMLHISDHQINQKDSDAYSQMIMDGTDEVMTHISDRHMELSVSSAHDGKIIEITEAVPNCIPDSVEQSSNCEAHIASDVTSNKGMTSDLPASAALKDFVHGQAPSKCSASAIPLDVSKLEHIDSNNPVSSGSGMLNLEEPSRVEMMDISSNSQEPNTQLPHMRSMTLWTNGGLLGLEPSKPPDFAMRNVASLDSETKTRGEEALPPNFTFELQNDGERGTLGRSVLDALSVEQIPGSKFSNLWQKEQDAEVVKSNDSDRIDEFRETTSAGTHGNGVPHNSNANPSSGNNGFHQKGEMKGRGIHNFSIPSLTSSPPLEHMKISFRPAGCSDTSKLKLKFPERSSSNGRGGDMFTSFQLVPDAATQIHDVGSESDDTFCRSSVYMSKGGVSHHSDSESEQWDSDESPKSKDPQLYDATQKISTGIFLSSASEPGEMGNYGYPKNGGDLSLSSFSLDLPSFDAVQSVLKDASKSRNIFNSQCSSESSILPPPLPPKQWRASKSFSDSKEETQVAKPEPYGHAYDHKPFEANSFKEPNPALKGGKTGIWQKQVTVKAKVVDEKEDLLQQIRSKSFSLRPTVTSKPSFTSGPTLNNKVTAILRKANAIRQAVSSDDGEDGDCWSDN